jgi:hypothetical protein
MTARVYADEANDQAVMNLLKRLEAREIGAVTFASALQGERLLARATVTGARMRESVP